jgi:hypothetical protein
MTPMGSNEHVHAVNMNLFRHIAQPHKVNFFTKEEDLLFPSTAPLFKATWFLILFLFSGAP